MFKILLVLLSFSQASDLFIDDPAILAKLETQGFDLGRMVFGTPEKASSNALLAKNPAYRLIAQSLASDLDELKKNDPKLSITMKGSHRLFGSQWLISDFSTFELVGLVNRIDRLSFRPESCGEIRLIYRLAYQTSTEPPVYSRLPMTLNAVFWVPASADNCRSQFQKWLAFQSKLAGPPALTKADLPLAELKSIEINMQSVRWPSTVRPDMAGYAEYLLRVFSIDNGKATLKPLENMPDVARISSDSRLRQEFLAWLSEEKNLTDIDNGIALIPEKFLATKATSVALHGPHRLANAPFSQLFKAQDFSASALAKYESFKTPAGLLRRLNDLSCVGCHQGRTVAGFHFLGKDKLSTDAVNSIFTSASPHFLLDQERRKLFATAVQKSQTLPHSRPISVRASSGEGQTGSHCGLGDASFASWTCAAGFECRSFTADKLVSPTGICVPTQKISGSPCSEGQITHNVDPKKDRIKLGAKQGCGVGSVCEASSVGFPNGMCAGSCGRLKPGETCGSIAVLFEFNNCLAAGKLPFAKCLSENVRPASMQECHADRFCRDDYICARTSAGKGACIPPYFLFQLRVDGHP